MSKKIFIFLFLVLSNSLCAKTEKIDAESGFSGFVGGGVGVINYKSNMFKGLSDDNYEHHGLNNSSEDMSQAFPVYNLNIQYTLSNMHTQFFFKSFEQDSLRFDFTQQLGMLHKTENIGTLSIGYIFPLVKSKTWKDPYSNGERDETDMTSRGGRISWEQVFGSLFNVAYTSRLFDVKSERSGEELGLSESERKLLDRNGITNEIEFSYNWFLSRDNLIQPRFSYLIADLDGNAMSYDMKKLQLSYLHDNVDWSVSNDLFFSTLSYDKENPIYRNKANADEYGFTSTVSIHDIANINDLDTYISMSYSKLNSDIAFYDSYSKMLTIGLLYIF